MGFPQPLKGVEILLGFVGYGADFEEPGELLHQVKTKEFGTLGTPLLVLDEFATSGVSR